MPQSEVKILEIKDVSKIFSVKVGNFETKELHALSNISFNLFKGKTLSLVGESGCGKTTIGKVILGLYGASSGSVLFQNKDIANASQTWSFAKRDPNDFPRPLLFAQS